MKEDHNSAKDFSTGTSRRSMIGYSGAALGAFLLGSPASGGDHKLPAPNTGSTFNVRDFGAKGVRSDNATKAFRDAIEACASYGGGVVHVPAGEYTTGTIQLRDHVTLNIDAGATLFLSQDRNDLVSGARAMIFAENAKNIAVTGRGTLDGLARYDYTEMRGVDPEIAKEIEIARAAGIDMRRYYRSAEAVNVFMFVINDCVDFHLSGVSIINSPLWTVRLNDCDRVSIRGVYIYSDLEKGVNADGIDIWFSSHGFFAFTKISYTASPFTSFSNSSCLKNTRSLCF